MTEIMGQAKKDNPVRRGWLEKAGTNRYRITPLGLGEAERLLRSTTDESRQANTRSPRHIYEAVEPFISHRVFLDYCRDSNEPRTWLGAAAFLSLKQNTANALDDKLRLLRSTVTQAASWMDEQNAQILQRGPVGGGRTIRRVDLDKLNEFVDVLVRRFALQMEAIRKKV
jgi:hypothetical protein